MTTLTAILSSSPKGSFVYSILRSTRSFLETSFGYPVLYVWSTFPIRDLGSVPITLPAPVTSSLFIDKADSSTDAFYLLSYKARTCSSNLTLGVFRPSWSMLAELASLLGIEFGSVVERPVCDWTFIYCSIYAKPLWIWRCSSTGLRFRIGLRLFTDSWDSLFCMLDFYERDELLNLTTPI